ncbi:unnamed protein product, partial [marine sediment metagenome]
GAEVVSGFKGTIDYYVWKGIACARAWPRSPGRRRAPAVEAAWLAFSWAASNWNELSPEVRQAYEDLATGTYMTARDIFTKSFINGAFLYLEGA